MASCLRRARSAACLGLCGIHMNKNVLVDRALATDEEIINSFDDLFGGEEKKPIPLQSLR